jgi:histidinol-phosphate phosphatase family protein
MSFDVVIPTAGRSSLPRVLGALQSGSPAGPARVIVVDDRGCPESPLPVGPGAEVVRGPGRGPAAARNIGWRVASAEWVAFLDDDVVPPADWSAALEGDLAPLGSSVAGSQGRIVVPLPSGRRPTDWERNVAGLERARWATADMAFRRLALQAVGGFDERFPHAYREDADLALRLLEAGFALARGTRHVVHPVRPADSWVSLRLQSGNAENPMMARLHGPGWRRRAGAPQGRLPRHLLTTAAGLGANAAHSGSGTRRGLLAVWLALTGELAWSRIAPGPRTRAEVAKMIATSVPMPAFATWHWARGQLRARLDDGRQAPVPDPRALPPLAILLDRDGTLVHDVPYNGDPDRVRPLPGVRDAVERVRGAGLKLAVVSNQSGIGRGLIGPEQVGRVNARIEELLGPLGPWLVCPHAPEAHCPCRKPAPGLILEAARALGVPPFRCAVIGDIGADMRAAEAAGARGVLVPTPQTRPEEIAAAPEVATTLRTAIECLLAVEPSTAPDRVAA